MKQLIKFEFSKLLKKKIVYIAMAAFVLIYGTMLWSWIFGNEWAVTQEGEQLYGNEAAEYNSKISAHFAGPLTDKKVQEILAAFPRVNGETIYDISNNTYYPVANLFAEKDGSWNGKTVAEVFPEFEEPPQLGSSTRWESFLYSMMYVVMMAGILMIIIISPVFSDEYSSGMDALILTSRNGKKWCAFAKAASAFWFTIVFGALILLIGFLMFFAGRGTEGWEADLQLSELMIFSRVAQPLKCYQAAIMAALLSMISLITVTGVTLLFSVVSRTSFVAIIASAVAYLAPMFLNSGNEAVRRIVMLFPINSISVSGIMQAGNFSVGEIVIPIFSVLIVIAAAAVLAGTAGSKKIFAGHQVG